MRDTLARLEGESEILGHLSCQFREDVFPRQAVEGVVYLYRRKLAGVVAEKSVVLEISRVEVSLPLLERVAAGPGENLHDALRFASPFSFLGFSPARLALSACIRSSILVSAPGVTSAVMSCPSTLRWMVSNTRSRTVSLYLAGSKASFDV